MLLLCLPYIGPAADPDVGSIDLQCSDVFFNVTYELQRRGERHGTILALNITCEGLDNEVGVHVVGLGAMYSEGIGTSNVQLV